MVLQCQLSNTPIRLLEIATEGSDFFLVTVPFGFEVQGQRPRVGTLPPRRFYGRWTRCCWGGGTWVNNRPRGRELRQGFLGRWALDGDRSRLGLSGIRVAQHWRANQQSLTQRIKIRVGKGALSSRKQQHDSGRLLVLQNGQGNDCQPEPANFSKRAGHKGVFVRVLDHADAVVA
ncbi:hypothetical protein HRbin30_03224 [bacterium HR30]|nr:hypothetical protein HRbin30_03224 [bacterium HR30]